MSNARDADVVDEIPKLGVFEAHASEGPPARGRLSAPAQECVQQVGFGPELLVLT